MGYEALKVLDKTANQQNTYQLVAELTEKAHRLSHERISLGRSNPLEEVFQAIIEREAVPAEEEAEKEKD
ncbi:MAG TPA: hypothetical protein PKN80_02535 [bacterium]|uniref:Uncharacterized protein n=1 Tax=candidate division TA06 bacterium ADurb.Bin417 TaxID=1852828 RepID=A0A1V5MEF6_UNCT6|nr:MAG: hypothetical protein BWY73_01130 [candidate division TA06 bacterium ADurb.Bin417]HNQ34922.1 hypothetical protein [bacterium]HNS48172.1 hypothetical protein [bacterium]